MQLDVLVSIRNLAMLQCYFGINLLAARVKSRARQENQVNTKTPLLCQAQEAGFFCCKLVLIDMFDMLCRDRVFGHTGNEGFRHIFLGGLIGRGINKKLKKPNKVWRGKMLLLKRNFSSIGGVDRCLSKKLI
jgi:hypothetical protein